MYLACAQAVGGTPKCVADDDDVVESAARWCTPDEHPCGPATVDGVTETSATLHSAGFSAAAPVLHSVLLYPSRFGDPVLATGERGPDPLGANGGLTEALTGLQPDTRYTPYPCVRAPGQTTAWCEHRSEQFATLGPLTDLCGPPTNRYCGGAAAEASRTSPVTLTGSHLTATAAYDYWFQITPAVADDAYWDEPGTFTTAPHRIAAGATGYTTTVDLPLNMTWWYRFCARRASGGAASCEDTAQLLSVGPTYFPPDAARRSR